LPDGRPHARLVRTRGRRWPRSHAAPGLLREAPAAAGRHGLRRAPQPDADPRRQRRPGRGRDDARRDHRHRLEGPAEPRGGAGRRRATIIRSVITGNLANDDGGGVYARRGGIQVYDSILSANLVDGSGGALGSTGDILVVRSHLDGNTTDGDGGAIYTDEDGDVTVIDSTVSGSDADGPGGAIFTLDGDVTIVNSAAASQPR
jgi:predicted outer membrane repeat protein